MTILDVCAIVIAIVLVWAKVKGWGQMLSEDRVAFFADGFAVLDPIEPGQSVKLPTWAGHATRTSKAVGDDVPYSDLQAHVVVEDSDRIDPDVVEHTRQSRLRAWQEQP